jgi:hypothetical protein
MAEQGYADHAATAIKISYCTDTVHNAITIPLSVEKQVPLCFMCWAAALLLQHLYTQAM